MKKVFALALAMVMCLTAFAVCGGSKNVNLDEVMTKINTEYKLDLKKIDNLNTYYQINNDDVKQFAAEINSDSNAPVEIVLVEAKDSDAAKKIETLLDQHLKRNINQYASYNKDNKAMAEKCKVTNENNFVTLIMAKDAEGMLKIFNDSVK